MMVSVAGQRAPVNSELLLPYFAPYAAYVLIANLADSLPREVDYVIRIIVTASLLFYFRKRYQPLTGPLSPARSILIGIGAGMLGALLWAALILPFKGNIEGEALSMTAFLARLVAAVLVVPLVEELLCRGYILGVVTQWQEARRAGSKRAVAEVLDNRSIHTITPGAATALAVIVSSAAFMLGHAPPQWLAAFGYGASMAGLWIVRRDLLTPIVAHAVTNLALYVYVFRSGEWWLW